MEILIILIFLILLVMLCAISFLLGAFIGRKYKPKFLIKPASCISEEQKRTDKKRETEVKNMLTYTGDEQPEIE